MLKRYRRGDIKLTRKCSSKELSFFRNNRYMHYGNASCTFKTLCIRNKFFSKKLLDRHSSFTFPALSILTQILLFTRYEIRLDLPVGKILCLKCLMCLKNHK